MRHSLLSIQCEHGFLLTKSAIERAQYSYVLRDFTDTDGRNGMSAQIAGFTKSFFSLPTLFKLAKSEVRHHYAQIELLNSENYLVILHNLLKSYGGINKNSLKGFLLKELFCHSGVMRNYKDEFNNKYHNDSINLNALYALLSSQLEQKINARITTDIGPQSNTTFSRSYGLYLEYYLYVKYLLTIGLI